MQTEIKTILNAWSITNATTFIKYKDIQREALLLATDCYHCYVAALQVPIVGLLAEVDIQFGKHTASAALGLESYARFWAERVGLVVDGNVNRCYTVVVS